MFKMNLLSHSLSFSLSMFQQKRSIRLAPSIGLHTVPPTITIVNCHSEPRKEIKKEKHSSSG